MASHYAQYMKEREDVDTIEDEKGFISYKFLETGCYIHTVFIEESFRVTNAMVHLCEQVRKIAHDQGYSKVFASVVPSLPGSTYTLGILIRYGFNLESSTTNFICLVKEI